jgi:hypothetical protein
MQPERRFDPFRVLSEDERVAQLAAYRSFLEARDGTPDVPQRSLSRREARMREIERQPLEWRGAVDIDALARVAAGERAVATDARTEWALVAGLANTTEAYGVDIELPRVTRQRALPRLREADLLLSIYVQESYHCRILGEVCRACGVTLGRQTPGLANRFLIWVIGALPGALRWIPIMAGELVGTAVFRHLHGRLALFDERPEVRRLLEELLREIWIDEVGHVAYLRAQLGPLALAVVRAALPWVVPGVVRDLPPLRQIGLTPEALLEGLRGGVEIPLGADWLASDVSDASESMALLPTEA